MEHQRLLAIMATPFEVAPMVDRRRWPVHVTLVGNFHIDCGQEDAISTHVAAAATDVQPFEVALGRVAHFGAAHNIPVLLAEHSALHRLHASFAERLKHMSGFLAVEPAFWGDGYRPHATLGTAVSAAEGETLRVDWITLVSLEGLTGRRLSAVRLMHP